jgi:hypothetical protein
MKITVYEVLEVIELPNACTTCGVSHIEGSTWKSTIHGECVECSCPVTCELSAQPAIGSFDLAGSVACPGCGHVNEVRFLCIGTESEGPPQGAEAEGQTDLVHVH